MSKHLLLLPAALLLATACGDKPDAPKADDVALNHEAVGEMPRNPHVMGIDLGLASDEQGRIIGGAGQSFPEPDTLHVSVRTQYIDQGTALTVALSQNGRILQTVTATVGENTPAGEARAFVVLPQVASLKAGAYQVEVTMNDASQGIREFTVGAQ